MPRADLVKTPTGVVMYSSNHKMAVELAKKQKNESWLTMLEPVTTVVPRDRSR